jgi:hypothetical protein
VVEDVEEIRSHLKRKPLPEFELSPQRQIDLRGAESAQSVASQISLHRRAGYRECGIALGAVSVPSPSDCAGIQRAPGSASRRAHAHRPRTARYFVGRISRGDLPFSGGSQHAPPAHRRGNRSSRWALKRAEQALSEGRDAIHDLRTSPEVAKELAPAVTALGNEMSHELASQGAAHDSAKFHVVVEGPRDLHPILRYEVYSIAREAVRNAFRHA